MFAARNIEAARIRIKAVGQSCPGHPGSSWLVFRGMVWGIPEFGLASAGFGVAPHSRRGSRRLLADSQYRWPAVNRGAFWQEKKRASVLTGWVWTGLCSRSQLRMPACRQAGKTDNLWDANGQMKGRSPNLLRVDRAGIEPATHGFSGRDKTQKLFIPASTGHFCELLTPEVLVVC